MFPFVQSYFKASFTYRCMYRFMCLGNQVWETEETLRIENTRHFLINPCIEKGSYFHLVPYHSLLVTRTKKLLVFSCSQIYLGVPEPVVPGEYNVIFYDMWPRLHWTRCRHLSDYSEQLHIIVDAG